jgi:hypothetical protein
MATGACLYDNATSKPIAFSRWRMKCPNCGHDQSDGWLSCQQCHIIFSRWNQPAAGAPGPAAAPPAPGTDNGGIAPAPQPAAAPTATGPRPGAQSPAINVAFITFFIFVLGAALWWVLFPAGKPLKPGAYIDRTQGFALNAPAEWVTLGKDNYQTVLESLRGTVSPALYQQAQSTNAAVMFFKPQGMLEFAPNVNVVVAPGALPPITEKAKAEVSQGIKRSVGAFLADFQQESIAIVKIDRLASFKVVYSGTMSYNAGTPGGHTERTLRFVQCIIPGRSQGLIVTFTCTAAQYDEISTAIDGMLDSFRVLKRPGRFQQPIQGAVIGGLIGALVFLVRAFFMAFKRN